MTMNIIISNLTLSWVSSSNYTHFCIIISLVYTINKTRADLCKMHSVRHQATLSFGETAPIRGTRSHVRHVTMMQCCFEKLADLGCPCTSGIQFVLIVVKARIILHLLESLSFLAHPHTIISLHITHVMSHTKLSGSAGERVHKTLTRCIHILGISCIHLIGVIIEPKQ